MGTGLLLAVVMLLMAPQLAIAEGRLMGRFDREYAKCSVVRADPRAPPSTFSLTYTGNPPASVQSAIDYALSLLDSWLVLADSLPVRINFTWANLTTIQVGLLGAAAPRWAGGAGRNFVAAVYVARTNSYLNGAPYEILAQFNFDAPWYFGTDGVVPSTQFDFVTVFLHEMIHGLGFSSLLIPNDPITQLTNVNTPASFMSVYDSALYENGTTVTPLTTWGINNVNRARLLQAETSTKLIFRPDSGPDISIYSPATFERGSTGSHLDPAVYSANSPDALMLPSLSNGTAIHNPGQRVFELLASVGHILKLVSTAAATTSVEVTTSTASTTSAAVSSAVTATTAASSTAAAAAATSASIATACRLLLVIMCVTFLNAL